jgi:hypothetical protein
MVALAAFGGRRIFAGALVLGAAIAHDVEEAIVGSGEGRDAVVCQPCDAQLETPLGGAESPPETPCREALRTPAVPLFQGFPTGLDGLQDNEPAQKEPVLALPDAGHAPEDGGDEGRQGGQDAPGSSLGKRWRRRKAADYAAVTTHHDRGPAHLQGLYDLGCRF